MKELVFNHTDFEEVVRQELQIFDRPITDVDALLVYDLDCSNFTFRMEDCDTLCAFKNLDWLDINIGFSDVSFLQSLENLEELHIEFYGSVFDFDGVSSLKKLRKLTVSGGDISNMAFIHLESLEGLPDLKYLTLHEFGTVDLAPLKNLTQLEGFYCGYANTVHNPESIGNLVHLTSLTLIDVEVDTLDFLHAFEENLMLELCGINIHTPTDVSELKRFKDCDLAEIRVMGKRIV